jgi:hypothetical protein
VPDPNYYRVATDSGSPPHRTDQADDENPGTHLARNLDELKAKMQQGWVLGFEACVRWNIPTNPYYFDFCLSRSPATETDAHFLDRLYSGAADAVGDNPPGY